MPQVNVPHADLEAALVRYLAGGPSEPSAAYTAAVQHRILPLFNDFMGCWALDMSRHLVFCAWEEPETVTPVSDRPVDSIGIHVALALGSTRCPALAAIRPARPADAVPCTACDGTGRILGVPENVVCACGGLGWLPPSARGAA